MSGVGPRERGPIGTSAARGGMLAFPFGALFPAFGVADSSHSAAVLRPFGGPYFTELECVGVAEAADLLTVLGFVN